MHARELVGYSANVFAANLAGFVNRRADALLMGIFWGPVAIGLYRLADRVVDVVLEVTMRPVGLVSLPVLSRLQNDPEKLREAVAKCLRTTLLISVPVLLVVLATSHELMAMLGSEWEQAGIALQFLCLVGIGKAIGFFTGPVLFAANRPRFRAVMLWVLAAVSTGDRGARRRAHARLVGRRPGARDVALAGAPLPRRARPREPRDRLAHHRAAAAHAAPALPGPLLSGGAAVAVAFGLRALGSDELRPLFSLLLVGGAATLTAVVVLLVVEHDLRARLLAGRATIRRRRAEAVADDPLVGVLIEPVDPSAEPFDHLPAAASRRLTGASPAPSGRRLALQPAPPAPPERAREVHALEDPPSRQHAGEERRARQVDPDAPERRRPDVDVRLVPAARPEPALVVGVTDAVVEDPGVLVRAEVLDQLQEQVGADAQLRELGVVARAPSRKRPR